MSVNGKKIYETVAHSKPVCCLSISRKTGRLLATAGKDLVINMWTLEKGACPKTIRGQNSAAKSLLISSDETTVVSGGDDGSLVIFDIATGKEKWSRNAKASAVHSLVDTPRCSYVAAGLANNTIMLWDTRTKIHVKTLKGHESPVSCVAYSPDARWMASTDSSGIIKLWELTTGRTVADLGDKYAGVVASSLCFHPMEYLLASSYDDGLVNFWCLENMTRLSGYKNESSYSKNPCRKLLFVRNPGPAPNSENYIVCGGYDTGVGLYSWEDPVMRGFTPMSWKHVDDMALNVEDNEMIAASFRDTNLMVYSLKCLKLFSCLKENDSSDEDLNATLTLDNLDVISMTTSTPLNTTERKQPVMVKRLNGSNMLPSMSELIKGKQRTNQISRTTTTVRDETHKQTMRGLNQRLSIFRQVPGSLDPSSVDLKDIFRPFVDCNDPVMKISVLRLIIDDKQLWTLDLACEACPLMLQLSKHLDIPGSVSLISKCAKRIAAGYGGMIRELSAHDHKINSSIEESRMEKCIRCKKYMSVIKESLLKTLPRSAVEVCDLLASVDLLESN